MFGHVAPRAAMVLLLLGAPSQMRVGALLFRFVDVASADLAAGRIRTRTHA